MIILLLMWPVFAKAQQQPAEYRHLFTAGVASGLMGGLYDGFYPIDSLKTKGDFGLGAPDKLDGELLVLNGKVYQTQYTGKTFEVADHHHRIPFCMVNFFRANTVIHVPNSMDKVTFYHYLDSIMPNVNGMYAIHIVDLITDDITIEISLLDSYTVQVPATPAFNQFDFKKDRQEDIKSVERGSAK